VTLPPGRFRLATSPSATGSPAIEKRIGMVAVAALGLGGLFTSTAEAHGPYCGCRGYSGYGRSSYGYGGYGGYGYPIYGGYGSYAPYYGGGYGGYCYPMSTSVTIIAPSTGVDPSPTVPDMSSDFHTYGVLWNESFVGWYFDGKRVAFTPTPADMHRPMYLLLNLAVGGSWPGAPDEQTQFPARMQVDYVRAYAQPE